MTTRRLVVYFSVPETDDENNMSKDEANSVYVQDGKVYGNTEYVAYLIGYHIGADIIRLMPEVDYPMEHQALLKVALDEYHAKSRPTIKNKLDIDHYDEIFVGYPIWDADLPMVMYTFFDQYDFSNKKIIPFCTHGGDGLIKTPEKIKNYLVDATVEMNGFEVYRKEMDTAKIRVDAWLHQLGY